VPVMMTALTAGLSLVPFILAADAPGKEILHPLAVVVLGGILTSTLLDQIVTPAVFYKFGKPSADRIIADREGHASGRSEWGEVESETPREADTPPFSEKTPKSVTED
ncbi:MAG: efflux RND transporter permease subunit, partial [Acidobacteriota bacterium]|nr:efflux RND transporter permease subunit [Acidobacteriota bacterium]